MFKFATALWLASLSFCAFSQNHCQEIDKEIRSIHLQVDQIKIPQIKYVPDEYNCSLVEPVLATTYEIRAHFTDLLELYEKMYFDCGKNVELIYKMEDIKVNIEMLTTLTSLVKNLDQQCNR